MKRRMARVVSIIPLLVVLPLFVVSHSYNLSAQFWRIYALSGRPGAGVSVVEDRAHYFYCSRRVGPSGLTSVTTINWPRIDHDSDVLGVWVPWWLLLLPLIVGVPVVWAFTKRKRSAAAFPIDQISTRA